MTMWYFIFGGFFVGVILLGFYLYKRLRRLCNYLNLPIKAWILILITIILTGSCINVYSVVSLFILHLIIITLLFDLFTFIWMKITHHTTTCRLIELNVIPIVVTSMIIGYGYYNINHIVSTKYTITSSKIDQDYKILYISDTHYNTIQDPSLLLDQIDYFNTQDYDLVLLAGDIVEEGTDYNSMVEVFEALGKIQSKYGSYYVYGNHDLQQYTTSKAYSEEELNTVIMDNGIIILDDQSTLINNEIQLIGRRDQSLNGRKAILDYTDLDTSKFILVEDHQPLEYSLNEQLGVDLEVSGHTHGGQVFPIGIIIEHFFGPCYGEYTINDFKAIVSSGYTGWGFAIRTEKHCEYVEINLQAI